MAVNSMRGIGRLPSPWKKQPLGKKSDAVVGLLRTAQFSALMGTSLAVGISRIIFTSKESSTKLEDAIEEKMLSMKIPNTKFATLGGEMTFIIYGATLGGAALAVRHFIRK